MGLWVYIIFSKKSFIPSTGCSKENKFFKTMKSQEENKEASGSEEQEIKEMQKRLTEAGAYEPGMDITEMKQTIKILNESTQSMHSSSQPQSPSESLPSEQPSASAPPPESPTENNIEAPKKSYSNVAKSRKSSPESVDPARRGSFEEISASKLKDRSSPKENTPIPKLTENEKKMQRKKTLAMDPRKVNCNEKDKPLTQPRREFNDNFEPFSLCNDLEKAKLTSRELIGRMSDYLQEVRDEWIAETRPAADDSEFQWGSPIQVGSRTFNSDRKFLTRSEPEAGDPVKESRGRASKRKAANLIANINNVSDSEMEADDDSALLKKRKPQQEGRNATTSGNDVPMDVETKTTLLDTPSTSSRSYYFADNKIDFNDDDNDIFEPRAKSKSPETFVPRRIIPPLPGTNKARRGRGRGAKACYKGPRAKKSIENSNKNTEIETAPPTQRDSPTEIVLDNDDVDFEDLSNPTDIKMLKMPLKERNKEAKKKLEDMHKQEQQRDEQKKIYDTIFQEDKKKKQEELMKKRIADEEEAKRLAKSKEERENEKKKMWNKVLNDKCKEKKKEKPRGLTDEEIRNNLEEDDVVICEDQPSVQNTSGSTSESRVPCPICNRLFPESEIENHASECDQFESETAETSSPVIGTRRRKNNLIMQTCHLCEDYETFDNNDYLEHVQICAEQHRKRRDSAILENEIEYQGHYSSGRKSFTPKGRKFN